MVLPRPGPSPGSDASCTCPCVPALRQHTPALSGCPASGRKPGRPSLLWTRADPITSDVRFRDCSLGRLSLEVTGRTGCPHPVLHCAWGAPTVVMAAAARHHRRGREPAHREAAPPFRNNVRLLQDLLLLLNQQVVAFPSKTLIFSCITWPESNITKKKNLNLAAFVTFPSSTWFADCFGCPGVPGSRVGSVWGLISVRLKAWVSPYFWFW